MQPDAVRTVEDLVSFWQGPFCKQNWDGRLDLVEMIDKEILAMCGPGDLHQQISGEFTAALIERLADDTVCCLPQAYVYLNSAKRAHQHASLVWMVVNNPDSAVLQAYIKGQPVLDAEKRNGTRHEVDLPSVVAANDNKFEGHLVDISRSGAKIVAKTNLLKGDKVDVVVPMLGRVAATVMWVATSSVGLAFLGGSVFGA
ncbi:MAG: PilZ domain-containing protein [Alphaproteobacteria bacterium]|nr:PilZ domain-containing protein [Alphaproteobacteria bacterium]